MAPQSRESLRFDVQFPGSRTVCGAHPRTAVEVKVERLLIPAVLEAPDKDATLLLFDSNEFDFVGFEDFSPAIFVFCSFHDSHLGGTYQRNMAWVKRGLSLQMQHFRGYLSHFFPT